MLSTDGERGKNGVPSTSRHYYCYYQTNRRRSELRRQYFIGPSAATQRLHSINGTIILSPLGHTRPRARITPRHRRSGGGAPEFRGGAVGSNVSPRKRGMCFFPTFPPSKTITLIWRMVAYESLRFYSVWFFFFFFVFFYTSVDTRLLHHSVLAFSDRLLTRAQPLQPSPSVKIPYGFFIVAPPPPHLPPTRTRRRTTSVSSPEGRRAYEIVETVTRAPTDRHYVVATSFNSAASAVPSATRPENKQTMATTTTVTVTKAATSTADRTTITVQQPKVECVDEDAAAATSSDKRKLSEPSCDQQQQTNSAKKLKETKTQPGEWCDYYRDGGRHGGHRGVIICFIRLFKCLPVRQTRCASAHKSARNASPSDLRMSCSKCLEKWTVRMYRTSSYRNSSRPDLWLIDCLVKKLQLTVNYWEGFIVNIEFHRLFLKSLYQVSNWLLFSFKKYFVLCIRFLINVRCLWNMAN